jgi:lipid-A-disaccharide synthase
MKYFLIAGEDSGDLHGSALLEALLEKDPEAEFYGMGGHKMEAMGMTLWRHYSDFAVMGVVEVLKQARSLKKAIAACVQEIIQYAPDKLILIDYGGFNMRVAKEIKAVGIPVHYYILPKVWAWNEGRVKKIAASVDQAYVIFPFEETYFRNHGVNAHFVGNPVQERIDQLLKSAPPVQKTDAIALLPGSRKQEIKKVLPVFLNLASKLRYENFLLALGSQAKVWVDDMPIPDNVQFVWDDTYTALRSSSMALVTSGTANLETALLNIPQVVCYKTSAINYHLGRWLIKVKYLSPVNLILEEEVVKELIQGDLNVSELEKQIKSMKDGDSRNKILSAYGHLRDVLGVYNPSKKVASLLVE